MAKAKKYIELRQVLAAWGRDNGCETQAAIARALNMSQPSLSQRLNGERSWTIDELHEIATLLGAPMDVVYWLVS